MRAGLESHLGSRQVGRVIYGAIVGLALIVALASHPPSAAGMIGLLVGTAVAVALAEVYADVVGIQTSERHTVTGHQVRHVVDDAVAVAVGIAFPAVFFVFAAVGVLRLGSAFALAKWSGLALIGFYGFWAARFAGATIPRALTHSALVALIGAFLIVLKSLVH